MVLHNDATNRTYNFFFVFKNFSPSVKLSQLSQSSRRKNICFIEINLINLEGTPQITFCRGILESGCALPLFLDI